MDYAVRDVTDPEGTKGLEATFAIDAPPGALLEVLWSLESFTRLFPDVKSWRLVRDGGDELDVEMRVDAVIRELRYVIRRTIDRARGTITWREIGGDLRRVRGGWRLEADGEGTRATYAAFIDVAAFVPTRLVRDGAKKKLGEMVDRMRTIGVEMARGRADGGRS